MNRWIEHTWHTACRLVCVMAFLWGCVSCSSWQEAKEVIALADSIDQTQHVIYDDTAALGKAIRCLDNPAGRLLMSNTLGKAYYYMGRNHSLSNHIAEAADCYIEADRMQIDDPIYRGRVNSCMGYICVQSNNDSLALIFYERANECFQNSGNEWYYAQSFLNVCYHLIYLNQFAKADCVLHMAEIPSLDSAYQARYYETKGLYFYEQQEYDSALVYFNRGLDYWQSEAAKCFSCLKMMQICLDINDLAQAIPYAQIIIKESNNPNYLVNAYYCLLLDAKRQQNVDLLSKYSHAREDANRLLNENMSRCAEAVPQLEQYLQVSHPWRWVQITLTIMMLLCLSLITGIWIYRQRSYSARQKLNTLSTHIQTKEEDLLHQQSLLEFEKGLTEIMTKYHSPRTQWRKYSKLKKDIDPWLRAWTAKLDMLPLSEQEKIFCTISLIYPNLSDIEIANFMCYAKASIRTLKNRILKKIGISSSDFSHFLHNLSECK